MRPVLTLRLHPNLESSVARGKKTIELRVPTQGTTTLIQQLLKLKKDDQVSLEFNRPQGKPELIGVNITKETEQRSLGSLDEQEIASIGGLLDLTRANLYILLSQLYNNMLISDETEVFLMHFKRG